MIHDVTVCNYAKASSQGQYTSLSLFNYTFSPFPFILHSRHHISPHLLTPFSYRSFPNPSKGEEPG